MKKVNVTICTGPYCCKTNAAWFRQFDQILCDKVKSQIEIVGCDCPGTCFAQELATDPHVEINNRFVHNATPFEVIRRIRCCLEKERLKQPLIA